MDEAVLAELRSLRARAYGPDADIAGDPVALARLRELEAPRTIAADEARLTTTTLAVLSDVPTEIPPDRLAGPSRGPRPRGRLGMLWAVSLVAVYLFGAGVATIPTTRESAVPGAHYYATIRADDGFTTPDFLRGYGGTVFLGFRDYLGLTPIVTDANWSGTSTDECLLITETAHLGAAAARFGGALAWGCGAEPFPAAATLVVDGGMPEPLRQTFGDGTVLQFVFTGDAVEVLKADPPAEADPSASFVVECASCHGSDR